MLSALDLRSISSIEVFGLKDLVSSLGDGVKIDPFMDGLVACNPDVGGIDSLDGGLAAKMAAAAAGLDEAIANCDNKEGGKHSNGDW